VSWSVNFPPVPSRRGVEAYRSLARRKDQSVPRPSSAGWSRHRALQSDGETRRSRAPSRYGVDVRNSANPTRAASARFSHADIPCERIESRDGAVPGAESPGCCLYVDPEGLPARFHLRHDTRADPRGSLLSGLQEEHWLARALSDRPCILPETRPTGPEHRSQVLLRESDKDPAFRRAAHWATGRRGASKRSVLSPLREVRASSGRTFDRRPLVEGSRH